MGGSITPSRPVGLGGRRLDRIHLVASPIGPALAATTTSIKSNPQGAENESKQILSLDEKEKKFDSDYDPDKYNDSNRSDKIWRVVHSNRRSPEWKVVARRPRMRQPFRKGPDPAPTRAELEENGVKVIDYGDFEHYKARKLRYRLIANLTRPFGGLKKTFSWTSKAETEKTSGNDDFEMKVEQKEKGIDIMADQRIGVFSRKSPTIQNVNEEISHKDIGNASSTSTLQTTEEWEGLSVPSENTPSIKSEIAETYEIFEHASSDGYAASLNDAAKHDGKAVEFKHVDWATD